MVEIEARDPGDPIPSREVGVTLEVAVAKAGAPDPRSAGCAARVTVVPAGAKRRVQSPSSSTSPIFYEEAGYTYIRPGSTATRGAGAGIVGAAAAGARPQTGGASARSPPFTASDFCWLFHAFINGRMATARPLLAEPRDRDELDTEPLDPWELIAELFNSEDFKPDAIDEFYNGVKAADILDPEPSKASFPDRASFNLSAKWGQFWIGYTRVLSNVTASEQNDPDVFPNFASNAGGMPAKVVMHFHCLSKTGSGSVLSGMGTRLMPDDGQREVGIDAAGRAPATDPSSGGRSRSLSRKRSRHDTVTSLRIEGLERNKMYDGAESRQMWSESCSSLAQNLREARSTVEALNKALQDLSDNGGDERAELLQEIGEMKHLKRSVRRQITET
jgi:hypothetical protein